MHLPNSIKRFVVLGIITSCLLYVVVYFRLNLNSLTGEVVKSRELSFLVFILKNVYVNSSFQIFLKGLFVERVTFHCSIKYLSSIQFSI